MMFACAWMQCLVSNLDQHGFAHPAITQLARLVRDNVGRSLWTLERGSESGQTLVG
jgi:hypothetical protein